MLAEHLLCATLVARVSFADALPREGVDHRRCTMGIG